MKELDYLPSDEKLKDINFWGNLAPNGFIFDSYEYYPTFSIYKNNKPIKPNRSIPYELAIKELERLSKDHNNISLKLTGYAYSLIQKDDRQTA